MNLKEVLVKQQLIETKKTIKKYENTNRYKPPCSCSLF